MCRNIKNLFNFDPPVTSDEVRDASLQFVRKISGFNKPSRANEAAFRHYAFQPRYLVSESLEQTVTDVLALTPERLLAL